MSTTILTPVGRLVQGSLYEANDKNMAGQPLTNRAGEPRVNFFFALAIPKGAETHWNQTEWGMIIFATGQEAFKTGQANSPEFKWKIVDGDSSIPNQAGNKPCDQPGFPRHWILKWSSSFAPKIVNNDGTQPITQEKYINLGDYIQVYGSVAGNGSTQQAGIYLNPSIVSFSGFGERIVLGVDPKTVGFGKAALPPGASATPVTSGFNPATAGVAQPVAPSGSIAPQYVSPHVGILNPGNIPAAPRVMLPAAAGTTYDQFRAAGWTDQQLIANGMMQA